MDLSGVSTMSLVIVAMVAALAITAFVFIVISMKDRLRRLEVSAKLKGGFNLMLELEPPTPEPPVRELPSYGEVGSSRPDG